MRFLRFSQIRNICILQKFSPKRNKAVLVRNHKISYTFFYFERNHKIYSAKIAPIRYNTHRHKAVQSARPTGGSAQCCHKSAAHRGEVAGTDGMHHIRTCVVLQASPANEPTSWLKSTAVDMSPPPWACPREERSWPATRLWRPALLRALYSCMSHGREGL